MLDPNIWRYIPDHIGLLIGKIEEKSIGFIGATHERNLAQGLNNYRYYSRVIILRGKNIRVEYMKLNNEVVAHTFQIRDSSGNFIYDNSCRGFIDTTTITHHEVGHIALKARIPYLCCRHDR